MKSNTNSDFEKIEYYIRSRRDSLVNALCGMYGEDWNQQSEQYARVVNVYDEIINEIARIKGGENIAP